MNQQGNPAITFLTKSIYEVLWTAWFWWTASTAHCLLVVEFSSCTEFAFLLTFLHVGCGLGSRSDGCFTETF